MLSLLGGAAATAFLVYTLTVFATLARESKTLAILLLIFLSIFFGKAAQNYAESQSGVGQVVENQAVLEVKNP